MTIGFVGLSHLGIVSSICWASRGWEVIGVDDDPTVVAQLATGQLVTQEPGLAALFADNRSSLTFTTDFSLLLGCDIVFISLDTETDQANRIVLSRLEQLIAQATSWLASGVVVVLMSQVPIGFTGQLPRAIWEKRPNLSFELCYWVETLVIGNAVERCLNPERVILGHVGGVPTRLGELLSTFSCPILEMSYVSAELTKAAINLYLSVSITFANVLANLCKATGASMREIMPALRLDRRIGEHAYIRSGLGIAGGHLERDLVHLQQLEADAGLIDYILKFNAAWRRQIFDLLAKYVFSQKPRPRIALWGLAYKEDTQSTKNSFAVLLLQGLLDRADLRAYDPAASLPADLRASVASYGRYEILDDADCLLVLTAWDEFADTDFTVVASKMHGRAIIDCVGILDCAEARQHGLHIISMGNL